MTAAQMCMRQMGKHITVVSRKPPPSTPPPTSAHTKRGTQPHQLTTPNCCERAYLPRRDKDSTELFHREVFTIKDTPTKQTPMVKRSSKPAFFNPTARLGQKAMANTEDASWFLPFLRPTAQSTMKVTSRSVLLR
jgi:hypothetical protein